MTIDSGPSPHRGEPILLAIDTCGATGSVALGSLTSNGEIRILATAELQGKTYSALLISRIGEVLSEANISLAEVAAIVVVNGPGSFTGVRIGVSAAKGLAEGAVKPVMAVSRLELLARKGSRHAGQAHACAALDAGRGQFYFGDYCNGSKLLEELCTREEVIAAACDAGAELLICEDAAALPLAAAQPILVPAPTATDALNAAAERFLASDFDDVESLDANYLRRPDAENPAGRVPVSTGA